MTTEALRLLCGKAMFLIEVYAGISKSWPEMPGKLVVDGVPFVKHHSGGYVYLGPLPTDIPVTISVGFEPMPPPA